MTIGLRHGPRGVLVGQAAGGVLFGTLALVAAFVVTRRLRPADAGPGVSRTVPAGSASPSPAAR